MALGMKQRPWPEVREEERKRFPEVFAAYDRFKQAVRSGDHPSPDRPFILVESPDDLPIFANEAEEHEFWGIHSLGDAWFETTEAEDHETPLPARNLSIRRR